MAVNLIHASGAGLYTNRGRSVARNGVSQFLLQDVEDSYVAFNHNREDGRLNPFYPNIVNNSGVVNMTGQVLHNGVTLEDVYIQNKGNSAVAISINATGYSYTSGSGFILASGQTMDVDGAVNQIWGITASGGTATVRFEGTQVRQMHNI